MDRRRLLRALGPAGLAALSGLAGCQSAPLPGGDTTTTAANRWAADRPSLPYREADPAANLDAPRGIVLRSSSDRTVYPSVVVYDGETVVFSGNYVLGPRSGTWVTRETDLVAAEGTYRVVVETADGNRSEASWRVSEAVGDLEVTVGDGVSTVQTARCVPECPPFDRDVDGQTVPYARDGERTMPEPSRVYLANPTDEPRAATLVVADDDSEVLRLDYRVPPGVRLEVPAVATPGEYAVTVASGDQRRHHDWHARREPRLHVRLGPEFAVTCGEATGTVILQNQDSTDHRVAVAAERDGEVVFEHAEDLVVGDSSVLQGAIPESGRYRFRAETDEGETARREWFVCAPTGRVEVTVEVSGILVVDTQSER